MHTRACSRANPLANVLLLFRNGPGRSASVDQVDCKG
jgi:hypothetical protein